MNPRSRSETVRPDTSQQASLFELATGLAPPPAPPPSSASIAAASSIGELPLPPGNPSARVRNNLTVVRLLAELRDNSRPATADERRALTYWTGWGAVPELFDVSNGRFASERAQLTAQLDPHAYEAARRSTLNAHYTHPQIAEGMWTIARHLGFPGWRILEPGCGAGVFIAGAPAGASVTGVELDPTTAAVAQALYPHAHIHAASYSEVDLPDASFDLAIGNVPFGDFTLYDPKHNTPRHSIHNYFLLKSLALLAPGGLLVALTSRYTLDARAMQARQEMHDLADLVAAVRLPSGAHRQLAGTDVITDLIVLRRRPAGQDPAAAAPWVDTEMLVIDGEELRINRYFLEHPQRVAGELALTSSAFGPDLDVTGETLPQKLSLAITAIAEDTPGTRTPPPPTPPAATARSAQPPGVAEPDYSEHWDGHIIALPGGGFGEVINGTPQPLAVPKSAAREMRQLLDLRDKAAGLLAEEAEHASDPEHLGQMRADLQDAYQRYVRTHGPINRYTTQATGRTDADTGEPIVRRAYPRAVRLLLHDPVGPLVLSLEHFDDDTQTGVEADLLYRRVLRAREPVRAVDTPEDALAVCYDQLGRIDLATIASLIGLSEADTRDSLGDLVYTDPDTGTLLPAAEYLSGTVGRKLERAREAAATDPSYQRNAEALEAVVPLPLGADEVDAKLGAVWISDTVHQQFLRELLDDESAVVEYGGGNIWAVQARSSGTLAQSEWGTPRMPAPEIFSALLEQKAVVVKDRDPLTDRYFVNPDETAAAQEKAQAIQERFGEWCWEEPERTTALLAEYNARFNSLVLRDYTAFGEALTLPGLSESFVPTAHQRTAVARIITEPAVGLFHEVGAGKTASMVIAAHELRRLGMVAKPVVVVPNHMLAQFAREWLQLYPSAKVLAASSDDLAKDNRRRFVARAAANEWDGIVMTRSGFERLPVSPDNQRSYLKRELDAMRAALDEQNNRGARLTVKKLERKVARVQARLEERLDGVVDIGIKFEETGIDYLFVDEAHGYKNLATASNIAGAAIPGSKRATDLHMKLELLRGTTDRVCTCATATPIANSITEAHVMCRLLRPDLLEAAGVEHFDAWAATFGEVVTQMEMAVTAGGSYRLKTRFSRFQNVPEMLRMWHVAADVKTAEDLDLPAPPMKPREDGERAPEVIVIPTPPEVKAYLHELADRAEEVKKGGVPPEEDNMLKISTDGRLAALDMRLVGDGIPIAGVCKLDVVAENIARIFRITRNVAYRIPGTDRRHPTLGSLQIVFCDLSTPNPKRWNAYEELRRLLIQRGVPRSMVRFIHEAKNDQDKARLFEACRTGQVAVIVGSTEKMGVGTNIQARAIASHEIDCAWRPADIAQRGGRILRQGNQNSGVRLYRYVVEGSFDAYMWQTVERKARFIAQIMRGRFDIRSIEDIGDNTLSFAEVKALAAGDTLILEQAQASADVTRMQRLERAHRNNQGALQVNVIRLSEELEQLERNATAIEIAIERATDTRGQKFAMVLGGQRYTKRADAAAALLTTISAMQTRGEREAPKIARLGGLDISVHLHYDRLGSEREALAAFDGLPCPSAHTPLDKLSREPSTLIRQLEARLQGLDRLRSKTLADTAAVTSDRKRAQQMIGAPFKHADALEEARDRLAAIEAELAAKALEQERAANDRASSSDGGPEQADEVAPVGVLAGDDIAI